MKDSLYYYDPNHGGCLRVMHQIDENTYVINGAYGSDEGKKGYWAAIAKKINKTIDGKRYNLEIDFEMKKILTHKRIYYANMKNRKIHWCDGNTWIQMYA